jgi:hypothetical protein
MIELEMMVGLQEGIQISEAFGQEVNMASLSWSASYMFDPDQETWFVVDSPEGILDASFKAGLELTVEGLSVGAEFTVDLGCTANAIVDGLVNGSGTPVGLPQEQENCATVEGALGPAKMDSEGNVFAETALGGGAGVSFYVKAKYIGAGPLLDLAAPSSPNETRWDKLTPLERYQQYQGVWSERDWEEELPVDSGREAWQSQPLTAPNMIDWLESDLATIPHEEKDQLRRYCEAQRIENNIPVNCK